MSVTLNPYTNCGKCASCRNGRVNACEHNETLGVQRNGVMCEYAVLPWTKIIPAGDISSRDCALIEPMSVGFHAVSRARVVDNEYVMVIGCGMIGIGAIVRAALRGATVIAVDLDDEKLQLAKRVGASYVINSKTENVHERMQEITERLGADVVIEAVGSPVTYVMAVDEAGLRGVWSVSVMPRVKWLFKRSSLYRKNWISAVPECVAGRFSCGHSLHEGRKLPGRRIDIEDCKAGECLGCHERVDCQSGKGVPYFGGILIRLFQAGQMCRT